MAGLEATSNAVGPINPAALIGQATPVVEPRAVSALSEAFRSGFITADDIVKRAGTAGKLRQKAEIQMLQEATSPEAQQARAEAQAAQTAQAQLAGAQAGAALPLAGPAGQLAATQLEEQQALQKYGPGIEYFKALAPEAGVSAPVTADGQPDYAKRAQLGLQLFEWKQAREKAKERLTPAHWEKSPDGSQLFKFNKQGELITPELEKTLSSVAVGAFGQPGAITVAPKAAPEVTVTPEQRAAAVEQGGMSPQAAATATNAQISSIVQPKVAPAATPEVIPGAAAYLGPPKTKPVEPKSERAAAEELGGIQSDLDAIAAAKNSIASSNIVGPGAGSYPVRVLNQLGAAFGARTQEFESQDKLLQLVNKRVLEGAQAMKGNLSDKDIRFLKESFPTLSSTEPVWNTFLDRWTQMLKLNEQIIRGTAPKGSSIFDTATQNVPPAAATPAATAPPGSAGPIITIPSTGRKITRDAQGNYHVVP